MAEKELRRRAQDLVLKYEMNFEVSTKPATVRSDGDTTPLVERITTFGERVRAETIEECAKIGERFEIKDEVSGAIRRLASGEGEK